MDEKLLYMSVVVSGFLLDAFLGDPENKYHPVRFIGGLISVIEKLTYPKDMTRIAKFRGLCLLVLSLVIVYGVFMTAESFFSKNKFLYFAYGTTFFYFGVSLRELNKRGLEIADLLEKRLLERARGKVSMIVGRDTGHLNGDDILRATAETMSENLNDGVVAPMFYFMLGGLPLMYFYKTINTLDSMVGYKNEKYRDFGYFSAKSDDVLNFIPARVTAFLIFLVTLDKNVLINIKKFCRAHPSPNSGFPESAMAGALGCRFGGASVYGGVTVSKPFIGDGGEVSTDDIKKASRINLRVSTIFLSLIILKIYFVGV